VAGALRGARRAGARSVAGGGPLLAHLAFRDYLRENPEVAQEYAELKRRLAEQYPDDRLRYAEAKSEFVAGVLQRAERG
jgi:GrpB-like predicted nucleotidyltransferase (UPF0157 family)